MRQMYARPLRVYLVMGMLAVVGVCSAFKLPISLFPNSTQPVVEVNASYGPLSGDQYRHSYGSSLEASLRKIQTADVTVEEVDAIYSQHSVRILVKFRWGDDPKMALREVEAVLGVTRAEFGNSSEYSLDAWINSENSGFLAVSFFSESRSPTEIFKIIDPVLSPKVKQVPDANNPQIWNPEAQEVRVEIKPESLAALQLTTASVEQAIYAGFDSRQGGEILSSGKLLPVLMPPSVTRVEDMGSLALVTPSRRIVTLREIANISFGPNQNESRIFKTNGASSVVLFSSPKPGGNVKAMAEDMIAIIASTMTVLPKDIQYRILVDPSEFIRSAVSNVIHEVMIGSCLAVMVLFIFIGSPKNVATAAIEIPISLILAFILMQISGMNINLISLGGLALSAGMNVDASVVVMENIFRHFESKHGRMTFSEKIDTVMVAVAEVRGPVISSTIASLVVFLPLAFTSGLSYAILGDLAKAVVFSHGFSAIVALVLVPTVRLHLMRSEPQVSHPVSPIDKQLTWLEQAYTQRLSLFVESRRAKIGALVLIPLGLGLLFVFILPKLPKEVVGKPDTDWVLMSVQTDGNSKVKQMEMTVDQIERDVQGKLRAEIQYTFMQVGSANSAILMLRLHDKSRMPQVIKQLEDTFRNTASLKFWMVPWNPSELNLPDPPTLQIAVTGASPVKRTQLSADIVNALESRQFFPQLRARPDTSSDPMLKIVPKHDQWNHARASGFDLTFDEIMRQLSIASRGRFIDHFPFGSESYPVNLVMGMPPPQSADEVGAFSVAMAGKLVPLRALADIEVVPRPPSIRSINDREVHYIQGWLPEGEKLEGAKRRRQAEEVVRTVAFDFNKRNPSRDDQPQIEFEDGEQEVNQAIQQLVVAIGWSVVLIYLTMVIQFGTMIEPLIVLAAVPLGIIGVLVSLFVFGSSLSLNSALGVILLNGIAVANSIMLVDFTKRLVEEGMPPLDAALAAARARLRPILITSLTTVLGMMPIATGFGAGGKVLQPLGIAVAGGLWVSMILTLFVVPALHVSYLNLRPRSGVNLS